MASTSTDLAGTAAGGGAMDASEVSSLEPSTNQVGAPVSCSPASHATGLRDATTEPSSKFLHSATNSTSSTSSNMDDTVPTGTIAGAEAAGSSPGPAAQPAVARGIIKSAAYPEVATTASSAFSKQAPPIGSCSDGNSGNGNDNRGGRPVKATKAATFEQAEAERESIPSSVTSVNEYQYEYQQQQQPGTRVTDDNEAADIVNIHQPRDATNMNAESINAQSVHSSTAPAPAPAAAVTVPVPARSATTASTTNTAPSERSKRKLKPSSRLSHDNTEGRYSAFRDSQTAAIMKRARSASPVPPPSSSVAGPCVETPRHDLMLYPNSSQQKAASERPASSGASETITVAKHVLEAIPSNNFTMEEILTFPVAFSYFIPTISKSNGAATSSTRRMGMCKVANCPKYRQGHCEGMCMVHYRESLVTKPRPPRLPTPPAQGGEVISEAKPQVTDHSEATAFTPASIAPTTSTELTAPTPTGTHNFDARETRPPDSRPKVGAADTPPLALAAAGEDVAGAKEMKPDDSMTQLVAGTSTTGASVTLAPAAAADAAADADADADAVPVAAEQSFAAQTTSTTTADAIPTPVLTITSAQAEASRKEAARRQKKWDKSMKSSVARFERRRAGGKSYSRSDRGTGSNSTGAAASATNGTSGGISNRSRGRSTRTSAAAGVTDKSVAFPTTGAAPPKEIYSGPAPSLPDGTSLPDGWAVKIFVRAGGGKDRYWFSPAAKKKLRSQVEVKNFLNKLSIVRRKNSAGEGESIGEDGGKEVQPTESADTAQPGNGSAVEKTGATAFSSADIGTSVQEEEEAWKLCNIKKK